MITVETLSFLDINHILIILINFFLFYTIKKTTIYLFFKENIHHLP